MKIKRLSEDSVVARVLAWLARSVYTHRRLFFYPQLLLFVLCIFYTVKNLEFSGAHDTAGLDKNWAGIRQEGPTLTVDHCYFHNNDDGLLTGREAARRLIAMVLAHRAADLADDATVLILDVADSS